MLKYLTRFALILVPFYCNPIFAENGKLQTCHPKSRVCEISLDLNKADLSAFIMDRPTVSAHHKKKLLFYLIRYKITRVDALDQNLVRVRLKGVLSWEISTRLAKKYEDQKVSLTLQGLSDEPAKSKSETPVLHPPQEPQRDDTVRLRKEEYADYIRLKSQSQQIKSKVEPGAAIVAVSDNGPSQRKILSTSQTNEKRSNELSGTNTPNENAQILPSKADSLNGVDSVMLAVSAGTPNSPTGNYGVSLILNPKTNLDFGIGYGTYNSKPFLNPAQGTIRYNTTSLSAGYIFGSQAVRMRFGLALLQTKAKFRQGLFESSIPSGDSTLNAEDQLGEGIDSEADGPVIDHDFSREYLGFMPSFGIRSVGESVILGIDFGRYMPLGSSNYSNDPGAPIQKSSHPKQDFRNGRGSVQISIGREFR